MKKYLFSIAFLLIGAMLLFLAARWLGFFPSQDVQVKGESSEIVGYISLATSLLSLLTGIASLIKTIFEARKAAK